MNERILKEVIFDGVYDDGLLSFRQSATIIDIGAHHGYFTLLAARLADEVYAIEPSHENFSLLQENTKHFDNVHIDNLAISDSNGEAMLYSTGDDAGFAITKRFGGDERYSVSTLTLATYMKENGIDKVDLVKIDCEGQEDHIFCASDFKGIAPQIKRIVGEVHGEIDLIPILRPLGYMVTQERGIVYATR